MGRQPCRSASARPVAAATLPLIHRDPFDRLLVAQARQERLTLLSADDCVAQYDVPTVRADL